MKQLHFCGGLPRSGSTVLMNILQQNPEVFTTTSDPFPMNLQRYVLQKFRVTEMFQAMDADHADRAIYGMAMGAINGWYSGLTDKPVVISKTRYWNRIHHLLPNAKMLIMIRDLRDVIESFNKVNLRLKALHSYDTEGSALYAAMTEMQKFDYHFNTDNSLSATLREEVPAAMEFWMYEGKQDNIKFIRYEDFLKNPIDTIRSIYAFLNLNYYEHDLDNISQSEMFEHDNAYFMEKTDHRTKPSFIKWQPPKRLLSERIHNRILEEYQWFYEGFYPEELK